MRYRTHAVLIAVISCAVAALGAWGLTSGQRYAALLSLRDAPIASHFDVSDWAAHWRLSSAVVVALGLTGVAAGVALMRRKRWAFVLLAVAALATVAFSIIGAAAGYSRYDFEEPLRFHNVLLLLVAAWGLFYYFRSAENMDVRDT